MKPSEKTWYIKRTQKDYSISFKLQVVQQIELGQLSRTEACHKYGIQAKSTIKEWLRKYGNFDWENQFKITVEKTPEQKILELEARVKLRNGASTAYFCKSRCAKFVTSLPLAQNLKAYCPAK